MPLQRTVTTAEQISDRGEYVVKFRRHCHQLIAEGYSRIQAENHSESEEDFITQRLKETIQAAQTEGTLPAWADRYFVADQAPVSVVGRIGKKRPKIDLEFQSTESRKRPVYHFEAKRLRRGGSSRGKYLGRDGLRMFFAELYGHSGDEGGMLGYVQSESPEHWAKKIQSKLLRDPKENHRLTDDGAWTATDLTPQLNYTYVTRHHRQTLREITIYHTLLDFRFRENQEPSCTAPPVATTDH